MNKRVLVFGKFDIFHPGHRHILAMAQKLGEVIVVLESDQAINKYGHYQPYHDQNFRQHKLEKLGFSVFVRHLDQDADYIISHFQPDILCLGEDQKLLQKIFSPFPNINLEIIKFVKSNLYKSSHLKSILEDPTAGVYLIDKPKGVNSFRAVAVIRKVLNMRRVGFSGTLDPLASGLLIVATGRATRLLDWFHDLPKTYQAKIVFGQESDSYDLETPVLENKLAKFFTKKQLEKTLANFIGQQTQVVPVYSAKKVQGEKLYLLARSGQRVKPPSQAIEIYKLKINKFNYPYLNLTATVSAGTYIRSLAHDLGQAMKTGAVLVDLERSAIGDFKLKKALALEQINQASLAKHKITPATIIESLS